MSINFIGKWFSNAWMFGVITAEAAPGIMLVKWSMVDDEDVKQSSFPSDDDFDWLQDLFQVSEMLEDDWSFYSNAGEAAKDFKARKLRKAALDRKETAA